MRDNNKMGEDLVDIDINSDPYRYNISAGRDSEFLRSLCDALDVGVSIMKLFIVTLVLRKKNSQLATI